MLGRLRQAYRERRAVRWLVDGLALLIILTGVSAWQTRRHVTGPAPAFQLEALSGGAVASSSLAGQPALVVFWAPWCTVCGAESQNISWVQRLVSGRARVISIAAAYEQRGDVERYVRNHGVDYPVLLGNDGLTGQFHVEAFPTVYFLDGEGRVKRSATGYTTTLGLLWRLLL